MKTKLLFGILFLSASLMSFAQKSSSSTEVLAETAVPSAVVSAYKAKFTTGVIVRWEKKTFTGAAGKTHIKYVAIFDQDGLRMRARYNEEGVGLSATTYYLLKTISKLPEPILNYAKTKYPDYALNSAEKEQNLKNGKYVYRIRLKKGKTKVVVYLNENGEEVNKDNVDQELLENESEGSN